MEKILQAVGDLSNEEEVIQNYERFKAQQNPWQFAVIKVGGGLIHDAYQRAQVAKDLVALYEAGLYPTVIHGAGPQLDVRFTELAIETPKFDGVRVTPKSAQEALVNTVTKTGITLKDEVVALGGAATYILPHDGVLRATLSDPDNLASVEELDVYTKPIIQAIKSQLVPIIGSVGLSGGYCPLLGKKFNAANVNADTATRAIAAKLAVNKCILLTESGGVLDANQQLISTLSVEEAEYKILTGEINGGMIPKVKEALCLKAQGIESVAITSPLNLLVELFTDEGKGTLIK